jgi:hypothetical protein
MGVVGRANLSVEGLVDGSNVEGANLGQAGEHVVAVGGVGKEFVDERLDQLSLENVPEKRGFKGRVSGLRRNAVGKVGREGRRGCKRFVDQLAGGAAVGAVVGCGRSTSSMHSVVAISVPNLNPT